MNPTTAPTAIIPSTPRLSTPDRSATSSPSAAISSGIDAVTMVRRMPVISAPMACFHGCGDPRRCAHDPDAVNDEGVGRQDQQHQNALKDVGELRRDMQLDLHR